MKEKPKILYRAEYREYEPGHIWFREFLVLRKTERGVWAEEHCCPPKFILDDSRKRLAYPTKAEAIESMRHRKEKDIAIMERNLEDAKAGLAAAMGYDCASVALHDEQYNDAQHDALNAIYGGAL